MARNTYTLDGIPLTDPAGRFFLEKNSGLRVIPAKRMPNISYPGLDGDAFTPGGTFLPGGVRVVMYVEGVDHAAFMANVEFLNALFLQRHKLLELRHDYNVAGTISRHAFVKFTSSTDIQVQGLGLRAGTIEYQAEIPGVFWRSATETTVALAAVTASVVNVEVPNLTGGNAPVNDALIRVKGAFSTLTLVDPISGSQLIINEALTSTQYVVIDTKNWTARKVTTNTWTGGTVVDMSVVSNRGMGSMFVIEPGLVSGAFKYTVNQSGTNVSGSPVVEFRAKKSYI